jgi:hypothetical protein
MVSIEQSFNSNVLSVSVADAFPLAIIGFLIIIAVYLSGNILRNEKLKEKAVAMMFDIIAFFVIIIFLTDFLLVAASTIAANINKEGYNKYCQPLLNIGISIDKSCHIFIARGYLKTLAVEALSAFETIMLHYRITKTAESLKVKTNTEGGVRTIEGKTASVYNLVIETYNGYLSTIVSVILIQFYFLDFFVKTFPTIFLLGVFLRAFPLTKKTGGLLLAIALSMIIFYPLMYSIIDIFYEHIPLSQYTGMRLNRVYFPELATQGALLKFDYETIQGDVIKSEELDKPLEENVVDKSKISDPDYLTSSTLPINQISENEKTKRAGEEIKNEQREIIEGRVDETKYEKYKKKGNILTSLWDMFRSFAFLNVIVPSLSSTFFYTLGSQLIEIIPNPFVSRISDWIFGTTYGFVGRAAFSTFTFGIGYLYVVRIAFGLAELISNFIIFSAVFSYIALISTIGMIKSLSEFLGGETEIAGLTHFL